MCGEMGYSRFWARKWILYVLESIIYQSLYLSWGPYTEDNSIQEVEIGFPLFLEAPLKGTLHNSNSRKSGASCAEEAGIPTVYLR